MFKLRGDVVDKGRLLRADDSIDFDVSRGKKLSTFEALHQH